MRRAWLVVVGLLVAACGITDDVRTVDEAIALLQDLEDNGVWVTLQDGMEALNDQDGYRARAHWAYSQTEITLMLTLDAQGRGWAEWEQDGQTSRYFIDGTAVYRPEDDGYVCAGDVPLLQNGVESILATYRDGPAGLRTLAVVDDAADDTVMGRDATRYELTSKFQDAVDILDRFDNEQLRARVEQAGDFDLSGTLYLDESTNALLSLESRYRAPDAQSDLSFAVTQWGDIAPVQPPEIATTCQP